MEDYSQYEITDQQQQQYINNVKKSIQDARQKLLFGIKDLGYDTSQEGLRSLSWTYLHIIGIECHPKITSFFKEIPTPIAIGLSKQDSYHHSHFIQACLCAFLMTPNPAQMVTQPLPHIDCCTEYDGDEFYRLELQEIVYHALLELMPQKVIVRQKEPCKTRVTNRMIYDLLKKVLEEIQNKGLQNE
jgi:hypothetical protein